MLFHLSNSFCLEDASVNSVVFFPIRFSAFIVVHREGFDEIDVAGGFLVIAQVPAAGEESSQIGNFLFWSASRGRNKLDA